MGPWTVPWEIAFACAYKQRTISLLSCESTQNQKQDQKFLKHVGPSFLHFTPLSWGGEGSFTLFSRDPALSAPPVWGVKWTSPTMKPPAVPNCVWFPENPECSVVLPTLILQFLSTSGHVFLLFLSKTKSLPWSSLDESYGAYLTWLRPRNLSKNYVNSAKRRLGALCEEKLQRKTSQARANFKCKGSHHTWTPCLPALVSCKHIFPVRVAPIYVIPSRGGLFINTGPRLKRNSPAYEAQGA